MNITTEEVAKVFPKLPGEVRQAIYIAVLEDRIAQLQHTVEILEDHVRTPNLNWDKTVEELRAQDARPAMLTEYQ